MPQKFNALRKPGTFLCFALLLLAPPASGREVDTPELRYDLGYDIVRPVAAKHAMVASDSGLASAVGVGVLRRGGNAVDAAVAVGFALAVTLPNAGNLGGGGFMLLHDPRSGKQIALDFRETAPARARRDMYLDGDGESNWARSRYTHLAVGVPGTVAGLALALKQYGTLSLAQVIAPAIKLAREGFVVGPELATRLDASADHLEKWPAARAIFFKDGRPLRAGERLVQADLAASLESIAREGAPAFYQGAIAKKIVAEMARHDGYIGMDDLKRYRALEREPVRGEYRGYQIVSMPPPSSGGIQIVEMLHLLGHFPLRDYGAGSAQSIHLMAEAMKLAYADRAQFLGDPDFSKMPIKRLTSLAYADDLAKKIDPERATPSAEIVSGKPGPEESDETTHYSVADDRGGVAAVTYTLNFHFGSGIVAAGTGILLNNEMDDFSAKPGTANGFGLVSGEANAIAPFKRPLSSMAPTIVFKAGKPWLVTGSPGGSRIITTTLQTIVNMIDFGMNPAQAAIMPRVHHQWLPDELRVEKGLSPDTLRLLERKGQHIVLRPTMGRSQTIEIRADGFHGYSDPRNPEGVTAGY